MRVFLVAFGLLLGLASTLSGPGTARGHPLRLLLRLPDERVAAVLALLAVAALLVLARALPRPRRRRRADEEDPIVWEPPPYSPWVLAALLGLLLLPLGVATALLWRSPALLGGGAPAVAPHTGSAIEAPPSPPGAAPAPVALPGAPLGILAIAGGLASLGLIGWIFFADRVCRWWDQEPDAGDREPPLIAAIDEGVEDLRREPDPRRAIARCYGRFERVLARSKVERAPWETPGEFMRMALERCPIPPAAVRELTDLFQLSRFSDHALALIDRDRAVASLLRIKAALERTQAHAAHG